MYLDPHFDIVTKWNLHLTAQFSSDDFVRFITNVNYQCKVKVFPITAIIQYHSRLAHMGIVKSNKCTFCNSELENYRHLFYECIKVQPLVSYIVSKTKTSLSKHQVLLNNVTKNPTWVINTVVLICKQYIYAAKCQQKIPSVQELERRIQQFKEIEFTVAKVKIDHHKQKWINWIC